MAEVSCRKEHGGPLGLAHGIVAVAAVVAAVVGGVAGVAIIVVVGGCGKGDGERGGYVYAPI